MKKKSREETRHTTLTAYPRASTINGCQLPSLHREAPVGANRERHGGLAGRPILGGLSGNAQEERGNVATRESKSSAGGRSLRRRGYWPRC